MYVCVHVGTLLNLLVEGNSVVMTPPSNLPPLPAYMPDWSNVTKSDEQLSLAFETLGANFKVGPPFPVMHINDKAFKDKDHFVGTMTLGKTQEWTIRIAGDSSVGAGNHPFHMHVNPFQVVAIGTQSGITSLMGVRVGEYRDTLPLWQSAAYTIRFRPDRYTGRALIHCHFSPHVDLGMAAVANIVNSSESRIS